MEQALIFISAKSVDYKYTEEVYYLLIAKGLNVFFSAISLPKLGNSVYIDEIDNQLEKTEHMIVVTSSANHLKSEWVKAEWQFFINEKRSKRKTGNLIHSQLVLLNPEKFPPV